MMRLPAKRVSRPARPAASVRPLGDARGYPVERVDHRVAGDVDRGGIDVLALQRFGRGRGRRAVQRGDRADDLAVDLLGPGMMDIAAAQARLDVGDGDLAVVSGDRRGHRCGGVALDDDPVGPLLVHHLAERDEQRGRERIERLVGLHQVEVVIGHDPRDLEHLVEHRAVLRAHANPALEAGVRGQSMDQREQLDRFRPGTENREDALAAAHPRGLAQFP